MDFQVDRKKEISQEISMKVKDNTLNQDYFLDMNQEVNRCNHIMKHILRSQYNYEGRLCSGVFLGTVALLFNLDRKSSLRKFSFKNATIIFAQVLGFSLFGFYYFGARRFGNIDDYRKNKDIYDESLKYDNEIKAVMKDYTVRT